MDKTRNTRGKHGMDTTEPTMHPVQRRGRHGLTTPVMRRYGNATRPRPNTSQVQRKGSSKSATEDGETIQRIATEGVAGSGGRLPHLDSIQASFGRHDVSGVRAHTGAAANSAAKAIGAQAYATGNNVAFDGEPGLHVAAHEAAHVVQQRGGVQLKGGVGQAGDSYEQHADEVADRVVRGESAETLLDSVGPASSLEASSLGGAIQRFGSLEHKSLGDNASGNASYGMGGHSPAIDTSAYNRAFQLTHGDIVMLSGDFFSPRDTRAGANGTEEPDPDSLFLLAGIPSVSPGQNVGTWDEVVYAIKKAMPSDPRFNRKCTSQYPEGHPWSYIDFSESVKAAVDARYLRRAAANDEHFVAPTGTDAGPGAGDRVSAGGSYRSLHEVAMQMAYDDGSAANASAREAAAAHFLTDHFAAGHLRTPRGSIRDHWRAIYPLFWTNIRNKIALDVATWINDNDAIGYAATVDQIYTQIQATVAEKTADIPAMGFDDLVSLVTHDYDNKSGVWVINDIGAAWKLYGDGHLDESDPENRTREMAEAAVQLGLADVRAAAAMGANKGSTPMTIQEVFDSVRSQTGGLAQPSGTKYGPEQVLPRLDSSRAAENGTSNWQQSDIDSLWVAPVHSATSATYGSEITASMQSGELQSELGGMADKFPESEEAGPGGVFTVHPKQAFLQGFLAQLIANPHAGLLAVINFTPSTGQAFFNQDDAVMQEINGGENGEGAMTAEQLAGMTLEQKSSRVRALVGGFWNWCGEDEGDTVVRLFETTSTGQRRALYEMVEGHGWTGDFKHGWFVVDDDLWDSLNSSQLKTLRNLIGD